MAADWLLLDGSSLMFRAFFGIPVGAFKAPDGQPVKVFAVTLEPAGGVPAPTGPMVLASAR